MKQMQEQEPTVETCIEVLRSIRRREYAYYEAIRQIYGEDYTNRLQELDSAAINKVILILKNLE